MTYIVSFQLPELNETLTSVYKQIRRDELQQRSAPTRQVVRNAPANQARRYPAELIRNIHALHDISGWSPTQIVKWVGDRIDSKYVRRMLNNGPSRGHIPCAADVPIEAR